MADRKITVEVGSTYFWLVVFVLLCLWLRGCVVNVNGTYYNVKIGLQAEEAP